MKFSSALCYRITAAIDGLAPTDVEAGLQKGAFTPCTPTQESASGFIPPRGQDHAALLESVDGQWVMLFTMESRSVPASVVRKKVEERVVQIEQTTGRKPGKKERRELKEDVMHELLPMAFTKQVSTFVWLDPKERLFVIDSPSHGRADALVTALVKFIDGFAVAHITTQFTPASAMAQWLTTQEAPSGFTIDRCVELRANDESKSTVRYTNHALDLKQVREHIAAGKLPTRLAMTWNDRVSFELTDGMTLRKVKFLEGAIESKTSSADDFDADVAITAGELRGLLGDLVASLGGEASFESDAQGAQETGTDAPASELYEGAVTVVRAELNASISLIQRHLRVGYNQAARLMEEMEANGVVSAADSKGARTLLEA
jgi:recombination associated protein RdgC